MNLRWLAIGRLPSNLVLRAAAPIRDENYVRTSTRRSLGQRTLRAYGRRGDDAVERLLSRAISALLMLFNAEKS